MAEKQKSGKKQKEMSLPDLKEAYQKILIWFFTFPTREMGLSDLAKALGISKTTANVTVGRLADEGFLVIKVIGRTWRISCNQAHIYNYSRKIAYNLLTIYESRILENIHKVIQNPRAVIVFGSYRKGDNTEGSDIDVAVEVLGNEDVKVLQLGKIAVGFRENVPVNLYIFSRNKIDLNLFSNITNGIILEGFLEARP